MKKLLCVFFFVFVSLCLFAETYTLSNEKMKVSVTVDKGAYISSVQDMTTGQEFIRQGIKGNLWKIVLRKDKIYNDPNPIALTSENAQSIVAEKGDSYYIFAFKNVKTEHMNESFDVVCKVTLKDNNSYWDMSVNGGKEYGIWEVEYPKIEYIDTQNGDNFFIPFRGDVFVNEFDNPKGFPNPARMEQDEYTKSYNYVYPKCLQYSSLTKGKSTLYMCNEDLSGTFRQMNWTTYEPNTMNVFTTNIPPYQGEAGHSYKQLNSYNISVFPGDWYDAAKKYRKWGIDNNYAPFSKGKIENRKDLPKWWKENCFSAQLWFGKADYHIKNVFKAVDTFRVPTIIHVYQWTAYDHDTRYPTWLPMRMGVKEYLDKFKSLGCHVMPYTNAHLIDDKLFVNPDENKEIYAAINNKGEKIHEHWAEAKGAWNVQSCIGSEEYYKAYINEMRNIFREYPFDALYIDQIGASAPTACFNPEHGHPVGGGTYMQENYLKLINDVKKIAKEERGYDIPVTTEDGGDYFWFDGWLKCNECTPKSMGNIVRGVVFSGYVLNFGSGLYNTELENPDNAPIINKTADVLTKGYSMGWEGLMLDNFWRHPKAVEYLKDALNARYKGVDYFNLGEMVRCVNITSENPKEEITLGGPFGTRTDSYNVIKTCSFSYHGKTMICFTNASENKLKVDWESSAKDLNLKEKKAYRISQIYPDKKLIGKYEKIGGSFEIDPLKTVLFVAE